MALGLVELYSGLLVVGLAGSQLLPVALANSGYGVYGTVEYVLRFASLVCLSFIMMHAGMHFHIDKSNLRQYGVDYLVAMTSAAAPWILAAIYFALIVEPHEEGPRGFERWKQALLVGRFAAPTSAGVLFSMLDAAGLSSSWLYQKAKILAIFDDLDTILLMIPLKVLLVGFEWEVGVVLFILVAIIVVGWRNMHLVPLHHSWYWVMTYSAGVAIACDGIALIVAWFLGPEHDVGEIHIEVLLPAFMLGMAVAERQVKELNEDKIKNEEFAQIVISAVFMMLVGLSMPPLFVDKPDEWNVIHGGEPHRLLLATADDEEGEHHDDHHGEGADAKISLSLGMMVLHVAVMSFLMVFGKLSCFFNYRDEASWKQRLALGLGMCPRGEVGAGVIVVAASVGVEGNIIGIAVLALALNLLMTGGFISAIRKLITSDMEERHRETDIFRRSTSVMQPDMDMDLHDNPIADEPDEDDPTVSLTHSEGGRIAASMRKHLERPSAARAGTLPPLQGMPSRISEDLYDRVLSGKKLNLPGQRFSSDLAPGSRPLLPEQRFSSDLPPDHEEYVRNSITINSVTGSHLAAELRKQTTSSVPRL